MHKARHPQCVILIKMPALWNQKGLMSNKKEAQQSGSFSWLPCYLNGTAVNPSSVKCSHVDEEIQGEVTPQHSQVEQTVKEVRKKERATETCRSYSRPHKEKPFFFAVLNYVLFVPSLSSFFYLIFFIGMLPLYHTLLPRLTPIAAGGNHSHIVEWSRPACACLQTRRWETRREQ